MADSIDERIGEFCKALQEEVRELPTLPPSIKEYFARGLDSCASMAERTQGPEKTAMFNWEVGKLNESFRAAAGRSLSRSWFG